MVDDFDIALFMSAYVEYHTEDPGDGSYIPMTVEEAQSRFLGFIADLQSEAWDEGYESGAEDQAREEGHRHTPSNRPGMAVSKNPYRTED